MHIPVDISLIHTDAQLPEYQTPGAVAFDIAVVEEKTIEPGMIEIFQTGLILTIPTGYALLLAARSSNAKKKIQLANGIGVIDQDYCGPKDQIHLALYNIGDEAYIVKKGERLAQGIIVPTTRASFNQMHRVGAKNRGGFGSTG
jgi:dUTP pyrophosphatase